LRKARLEMAKLQRKVANQQNDFQHKLTASWVSRYGLIATETLRVKPMSAQGGSRKAGLKGMQGILQKLAYKAHEAGTRLAVVPTPRVRSNPRRPAPSAGARRRSRSLSGCIAAPAGV